MCTKNRVRLFGKVIDGKMYLNRNGEIAVSVCYKIEYHFKNVKLDEFIIMPDHVHGIIQVGVIHELPQQFSPVYFFD